MEEVDMYAGSRAGSIVQLPPEQTAMLESFQDHLYLFECSKTLPVRSFELCIYWRILTYHKDKYKQRPWWMPFVC